MDVKEILKKIGFILVIIFGLFVLGIGTSISGMSGFTIGHFLLSLAGLLIMLIGLCGLAGTEKKFVKWGAVVAVILIAAAFLYAALFGINDNALLCGNPGTLIKEQLSKAYVQQGITLKSITHACFKSGITYNSETNAFKDTVGGNNINFACGSDLGDACVAGNNILTVNANFDAYIRACCGASSCNVLISNVEKVVCPT